jgi:hypothetical protein
MSFLWQTLRLAVVTAMTAKDKISQKTYSSVPASDGIEAGMVTNTEFK